MKEKELYNHFLTFCILLEIANYIFSYYTLYFIDFTENNIYEVSEETKELVNEISKEMGVNGVSPRMLKSCISCDALAHKPSKQIYLTKEEDEFSIRHEIGHLKEPLWFEDVMMVIVLIGFCSSLSLNREEWRLYLLLLLAYPFFALELIANYYSSFTYYMVDFFFTILIWVVLYYNLVRWLYGRMGR